MKTTITTETVAAVRLLRTELSRPSAFGSHEALRDAARRLADAGVLSWVEEQWRTEQRAAGPRPADPRQAVPFHVDLVYYTSMEGRVSDTRTAQDTVMAADEADALAQAERNLGDKLVRAKIVDYREQLIIRSNNTCPAS